LGHVPADFPGFTAAPDDDDKPKEACGVFGVYAPGQPVAHLTYDGLYALQHRGQESAGMAVSDGDVILVDKDMGLVTNVFNDYKLAALPGYLAIGHTRYSTTGSSCYSAAQPVHRSAGRADSPHSFALAHNGNLTNTEALAAEAGMLPGMIASDSELIAELVARAYPTDPRSDERELEKALMATLPRLEGAFSLTIMDEAHLVGVRDPNGFRPLCLGRLDSGWVLASETPALDVIGAHFVREVEPGEMVVIDANGIREYRPFPQERIDPRLCLFEFVYFARPDSVLYGREVHGTRQRMGEALAEQAHVDADIVIGVPETALAAAEGYARAAGIPYGQGLIKNRYIGRTFISPSQVQRDRGVRRKLNPLKENIAGKRVVVVDDSIVRGTTSRAIVRMLRDAGASEVHFRVMSPPYRWPCFYGMDTGTRAELLAANMTIGEIQDYLGVESLAYLTIEGLEKAVGAPGAGFCNACLTGEYPVTVSPTLHKGVLEGNDMPAPDLV
jgi:amidophosphoribosyltransferase